MLTTDEDAVICDLAETYGIYNYRDLPLSTVAVLVCGLGDDSRIVMKMANTRVKTDTLLLAMAVDALRVLAWQNTADGQKGTNIPESIAAKLMGAEDNTNETNYETYASGEEFKAAWKAIVGD